MLGPASQSVSTWISGKTHPWAVNKFGRPCPPSPLPPPLPSPHPLQERERRIQASRKTVEAQRLEFQRQGTRAYEKQPDYLQGAHGAWLCLYLHLVVVNS